MEIDAAGERRRQAMGRVLCLVRRRRTMFSMPLAYPSTLDHRPQVAHTPQRSPSYVEELWSPYLACCSGKEQAKADAYHPRVFPADNTEALSLSGGASIRSRG